MKSGTGERRKVLAQERQLVRGMLGGDEAAFELFCDDYIPVIYRFARRRLGGDDELAREIVQSTVCKAIAGLKGFRGKSALTTWLCACCRNEIAAHFRRHKRPIREVELKSEEVESGGASHHVPADGPELQLLRKEGADLVHEALDALPPHYGRALEWKYLEELSVKEIAERLELGSKATESLLTRARESFRLGYMRLLRGPGPRAEMVDMRQRLTAVKP